MRRRYSIAPLRAALLGVSLALFASSPVWAADKPNIVVILCDDLGYGDLACFANPEAKTPNLDKLAQDGLKLTCCYSAMPVCSPSRAGLITGRNPNRLGIRDWIPQGSGVYLRSREITLAHLLKRAGYMTCHAGKWHLNSQFNGQETTPGEAGFDHWIATQNNAAPGHLNPTNFVRNRKRAGELQGPSSHVVVQEAIEFVKANPNAPFFLNLWFHETHEPVVAADEYLAEHPNEQNIDRRHYLGDVTQMDAAVGKLMAFLEEKKLAENTLVVFTSDNGPEGLSRYPKATRSYGVVGPLKGNKLHVSEGGYRVPGIVRWPAKIAAGSTSAEPVCSLDFVPTFCAIAGVSPPKDRALDGTDVSAVFLGGKADRQQPLFWQYDYAISKPFTMSLRDGDWKLLGNATLDKFELYNLASDMTESQNVADAQPERVAKLAAEMRRLRDEIAAEGATSGNPAGKK